MKEKIRHIKQYLQTHKKMIIILSIVKLLIKIGLVGYFLLSATECMAQSTNKLIRSGNQLYYKQKFNNATEEYTIALQKDPKNVTAYFNQSDALYELKQYQKSIEQFTTITKSTVKPGTKAKAYHNLGNSYYKQEKYEESIKAYKNALKLDPSDKDTKYNLMMAIAKLQTDKKNKKKNDQDNMKPSEYAKKLKQQADQLVASSKFKEAYALMMNGLKVDKTVGCYNDFIKKLEDVVTIMI